MNMRALACVATFLASGLLAGCSFSSGGGSDPAPSRTYVILPNGTAAPVATQ